jgi:hypothetical protein
MYCFASDDDGNSGDDISTHRRTSFSLNLIVGLCILFRVYPTNTLIKTTVRNKYLFVLDFIVHYYNILLQHFT